MPRSVRFECRFRQSLMAAAALFVVACQEVAVTTVPVDRVEVEPATAQVTVNGSLRLTARVLSETGQVLPGRTIAWTSLDTNIATVDGEGNVSPLAPGTATIRASSGGAAGEATVTVTASPAIAVAPVELSFTGAQNGANPGDRTVAITNSGTGSLTGLAVNIRYSSGQPRGWLSASLSGTTAPATLLLSASQSGLAPGTYTAVVDVSSSAASNSPVGIAVSLIVQAAQPSIGLSATSVSFTASAGGPNPSPQTVSVSNAGGGTLGGLSTSISYSGSGGGWLDASLSGTTAPATLTLSAAAGSRTPGTYQATVRVSSSQAVNSPQEIQVTLTVVADGGVPGVPGDVTGTRLSATRIQLAWTPPGGQTHYDIRRRVGTGGGWTFETTAPAEATGYLDEGVLPLFTYQYQVRACNAVGCSDYSTPTTVGP
jgi:hypothetical protein